MTGATVRCSRGGQLAQVVMVAVDEDPWHAACGDRLAHLGAGRIAGPPPQVAYLQHHLAAVRDRGSRRLGRCLRRAMDVAAEQDRHGAVI